jgi:Holliday junction resolvase
MTMYRRGYHFELRVRKHFESLGWLVWRSAGSRSQADLVALKAGEVVLIQCKLGGVISKQDKERLAMLARELNCRAVLAYRGNNRLILEDVTANE